MLPWHAAAVPTSTPSLAPETTQRIELVRTHSPRFPGFTVSIDEEGQVHVLDEGGKQVREGHLPGHMTSMLFTSMQMAESSIASMPTKPCTREARAGGQVFLRFDGSTSPDLSCNSSSVVNMVWGLMKQAMSLLGLNNYLSSSVGDGASR